MLESGQSVFSPAVQLQILPGFFVFFFFPPNQRFRVVLILSFASRFPGNEPQKLLWKETGSGYSLAVIRKTNLYSFSFDSGSNQ